MQALSCAEVMFWTPGLDASQCLGTIIGGCMKALREPSYPRCSWRVALELKTLEKRLQPEGCDLKLLSQVPPQPFTEGEDRSSAAWPCWSWLTQLLKHISFSPGST